MSSKVGYVVSCARCHKVMGELDTSEYFAFVAKVMGELDTSEYDEWDSGLCFDCDPDSASATPSVFWQWDENELIDIGDVGFQVRDNVLRVIGFSRAHVHEGARARGLSSYTYLNRNNKDWAVLGNLTEYVACPECFGESAHYGLWYRGICGTCNNGGTVKVFSRWVRQIVFGEDVDV